MIGKENKGGCFLQGKSAKSWRSLETTSLPQAMPLVAVIDTPLSLPQLQMSIDINWETLTTGPDGEALAEKIREFVHERFQHITLPKLIRSVKVRSFDFGKTVPEIVLKDICDPLADFYEGSDDGYGSDDEDHDGAGMHQAGLETIPEKPPANLRTAKDRAKAADHTRHTSDLSALETASNAQLSRGTTPGFLHGTSNIGYFNLPLGGGFSGTNTPLAAVAGARFGRSEQYAHESQHHQHAESFSSISPPPSITPPSRPGTSRDEETLDQRRSSTLLHEGSDHTHTPMPTGEPDRSPEDMQVVFHVKYSGDVRLAMTADVFLDYPMPSFVGIPLKLTITGLTFDGVGILAYIKRKAHLCFLAPEDAEALVGLDVDLSSPDEHPSEVGASTVKDTASVAPRIGGLIEDIKIESEMGETESGKQVLKNVGKIEKFILEQVQRIFEDEFVYPSFWTFLV